MNINYDCIKDVMIYLRNNLSISQDKYIKYKFEYVPVNQLSILNDTELQIKYSQIDIGYSLQKLRETTMIVTQKTQNSSGHEMPVFDIIDITMDGYEFIGVAENNTIWKNVKSRASKIGGGTLKALIESAKFLIPLAMEHPDTFQKLPEFLPFL